MYLLAFESSCDDTSVALLKNDTLISMVTHTQKEHIATLGVVPEIAARLHADFIFELTTRVLQEWWINLDDIDIFVVTNTPWLIPSLIIWKTVAKTLSRIYKKPLIFVDHIEGHIFSLLLERKESDLKFPIIILSASWWHNDLFLWKDIYTLEKIGQTLDDSAGESMDKVGRSLGLPFPAGKYIDMYAQKYDKKIHTNLPMFPLVLPEWTLNFSFSWLKSAAIREIEIRIKNHENINENDLIEISYSYQDIIIKILSHRIIEAQKLLWSKSIALVGWVSANTELQKKLKEYSLANSIPYYTPKSIKYCWDNAAMIGMRGFWEYMKIKS